MDTNITALAIKATALAPGMTVKYNDHWLTLTGYSGRQFPGRTPEFEAHRADSGEEVGYTAFPVDAVTKVKIQHVRADEIEYVDTLVIGPRGYHPVGEIEELDDRVVIRYGFRNAHSLSRDLDTLVTITARPASND